MKNSTNTVRIWTNKECEIFVRETCQDVWNYILVLTGDPDAIADLTEDSYHKWYVSISGKTATHVDAKSHLFRVAYATLTDRRRRTLPEERKKKYRNYLKDLRETGYNASEEIVNILLGFLEEAKISEKKKDILRLWTFGGFPVSYIAHMMNLSVPTAFRKLKSVIKRLRKHFIKCGLRPEDLK